MHSLPALTGSAPLLTGAVLLAIALSLGACSSPGHISLATIPTTLPSPSQLAASTPVPTVKTTLDPTKGTTAIPATSTRPPASPDAKTPTAAALPAVDADCGTTPPVTRPTTIMLACADGSLRLEHLSYGSYGAASASGSGSLRANSCRPDCAHGQFDDYPVTFTLGGVTSVRGLTEFSQVTVHHRPLAFDPGTSTSYPID